MKETPLKVKIEKGDLKLRQWGLNMCNSAWFERFILLCIVINTLVLTLKW